MRTKPTNKGNIELVDYHESNKESDTTLNDHDRLSQSNELNFPVDCDSELTEFTEDSNTENVVYEATVLSENTIQESIPSHHRIETSANAILAEPMIEITNVSDITSQENIPIKLVNNKDLSDAIMNAEITYVVDTLNLVGEITSDLCTQKGILVSIHLIRCFLKNKYKSKTNYLHFYR